MSAQPQAVATVTEDFKRAFGNHPAGVAVITADPGTGPVGLTASSVASVSAAPPILAFSLASSSGSAAVVAAAETFVVHLLTAADLDLARLFATPGNDRFTEALAWRRLPTGEPLLAHGGTALRCRALSRTPAGGSLLIAAEVLEIVAAEGGAPLVYHGRAYHALGPGSLLR